MRFRRRVLLMLTAFAAACSDATRPGAFASIRVESGGASSDTILAIAPIPLVVQVRDSTGRPASGVLVTFAAGVAPPVDSLRPERGVYVCSIDNPGCSFYYDSFNFSVVTRRSEVTDSLGRARISVEHGVLAVHTSVDITVRSLGLSTTVAYTTLPGSLARVVARVGDTAIYVGHSYAIGASAADQFGNPRSEAVTLRSVAPSVATVDQGRLTAVAVGRGRILMQAGSVVDTAFASIPPPGRLVALDTGLTLLNTDGTGRRLLLTTQGDNTQALPVWSSDGAGIVFQERTVDFLEALQFVDTLGNKRSVFAPADDVTLSIEPTIAAGNGTIYFLGQAESGASGIYRASVDGKSIAYVALGVQPAPSPDESRLAYVSGISLLVRDLSTGMQSEIAQNPVFPRWSPTGNLIAFLGYSDEHVHVIHPDGTQSRVVDSSNNHDNVVNWSPDGEWLVVSHYSQGFTSNPRDAGIDLIRVTDGELLPIPWTRDLSQPAWRPF